MKYFRTRGKRMRVSGSLVASAALCAMSLGATGAASAAPGEADREGGNGKVTGGDVSGRQHEFAGNPDSAAKLALTQEWQRMLDGETSPAAYRAAEARFRMDHVFATSQNSLPSVRATKASRQETMTGLTSAQTESSQAVATAVASKTLSLTHYAQAKGYYCGPASGAMLVKITNGAIASRYNGASFSQGHFAGLAHMKTEANGATTWGSGLFADGVDRWRGANWYVQVDSPSASLMTSALTHSIGGNSMPLAADTVEFAGGAHYNGHPVNQTIGHWILAYGYTNTGGTVKLADPSTSVWSSVASTFSASTSTFTNNYLQTNGIAY